MTDDFDNEIGGEALGDFAYLQSLDGSTAQALTPRTGREGELASLLNDCLEVIVDSSGEDGPLSCALVPMSPTALQAQRDEYLRTQPGGAELPEWLHDGAFWHVVLVRGSDIATSMYINIHEPLPALLATVLDWLQTELMLQLMRPIPVCRKHPKAAPMNVRVSSNSVEWRCPVDEAVEMVVPI